MVSSRCLLIGLLLVSGLAQSLAVPVADEPGKGDPTEETTPSALLPTGSTTTSTDGISSSTDLNMEESSAGTTGSKAKGANHLSEAISKFKDRVENSRSVLSGIVNSFVAGPTEDGSRLEESLAKYDEIVEDIEADFTKAKLDFGLMMEGNIDKANATLEAVEGQLNEVNSQFIHWSEINRARMTDSMKKSLLQFNDFLSSGIELFLDVSERGKDVLRNLHRKRFSDREKQPDQDQEPSRPSLFIPFLGQL